MAEELELLDGRAEKDDPIRKIFSFDFSNGAFLNPRCKLCRSPFRKEAEQMMADGKSVENIKTYLDEKDDIISPAQISNHMKKHYQNMEQMAALMDYCDRLDELKHKRKSRENDVDLGIRVCYMELARAIAMQTRGDIAKEKIRTELILKIQGSILDGVKTLNDMEKQEEALKALELKFAEAWKTCIETADPQEKQVYAQALREFKKILEKQDK